MTKLEFSGKVESGQDRGRHFMALPWVQEQVQDLLGFEPYPGTLNLRIDETFVQEYHEYLEVRKLDIIKPANNSYYPGVVARATLNETVEGAIVLPLIPEYPMDLVEIISSVFLRDALAIGDGDIVSVVVS